MQTEMVFRCEQKAADGPSCLGVGGADAYKIERLTFHIWKSLFHIQGLQDHIDELV